MIQQICDIITQLIFLITLFIVVITILNINIEITVEKKENKKVVKISNKR